MTSIVRNGMGVPGVRPGVHGYRAIRPCSNGTAGGNGATPFSAGGDGGNGARGVR
jgi:hypothetical protein